MNSDDNIVRLEYFMNYKIRGIARFVGADIFPDDYQMNFITYMVVFVSGLFIGSWLWMCVSGVGYIAVLEGLTLLCMALQGMSKLYIAIFQREIFKSSYRSLHKIHKVNSEFTYNKKRLNVCLDRCDWIYKFFSIAFSFVFLGYASYPILLYLYDGTIDTMLTVKLPYITIDTVLGYITNQLHQMILLFFGVCGFLTSDMSFLTFVLHTMPIAEIFKDTLNKMDVLLNAPVKDKNEIKKLLREVYVQHQNINIYIQELNNCYSSLSFIQVVMCAGTMTVSLFLIVLNNWIPGFFLFNASFTQLLNFSILGTIVELQNDKVLLAIYDFAWYELSVEDQKTIIIMLRAAQAPAELTVGNVAKLNVEMCMGVLKTIYTYFMMLLEFIGD